MLLSTTLVNVSGEEAIENNDFNYSIDEILKNEIIEPKLFEKIQNHLDDDSLELPLYVPGELIVKFKQDTNINLQSVSGSILTSLKSIDDVNSKYGGLKSAKKVFKNSLVSSLSNVYKFSFSSSADISSIVSDYNSESSVVYAEPNYIYSTSYAQKKITSKFPNDPLFGQQWALNQSSDCDIDAPEAWSIKTGDPNVVIAIVDTGVDYYHPDLVANIWHDPVNGNPGYDFVDINTTLYIEEGFTLCPDEDYTVPDSDPMDVFGHGTHCAGIASAVTNNSIGVAGVCWNCKIMPVKAGFKIKYGGQTTALLETDNIVVAILYAADNGADVISMSWGSLGFSQMIKDALDYAYEQGVVLVAGAGNDNEDAKFFYPASNENVISVAATDDADNRASFSNYGESVDVAAPGVNILSLRASGTDMYGGGTHVVDENYYIASGTSMACPHVAGLAGLILSKNQNCPYPAQMVQSMIPYTTDKIDTDQYIGTGRINAYKALVQKPFAALLDSISSWEDIKGTIDIKGIAWGEEFQYFVLEDGLGENPNSWTTLKTSSTSQGGILLSLNTKLLAERLHTIRLKVVYSYGTFTDEILIYVNNQADGSYNADIFVSNCFDSSTPGWGVTRFSKIQDSIDHAQKGNTIFVYDGVYPEHIVIRGLSKSSISLFGQHKNWTIIGGEDHVNISITHHVTLSGFTIREQVILFTSSKCTISNNNIALSFEYYLSSTQESDLCSVYLIGSSNNIISNNNIYPTITNFVTVGVVLRASSDNTISENNIKCTSTFAAQYLSNKNTIRDNILNVYFVPIGGGWVSCGYGVMISGGSSNNVIQDNYINNQYNAGVFIAFSYSNVITKNSITSNGIMGIMFIFSFLNKVIANEITAWVKAVHIDDSFSKYNKIYYNNFYDCGGWDPNGIDSKNLWYKEKLFGKDMGNYWSIYENWHRYYYGTEPKDENPDDGIWDDPFIIQSDPDYEPSQDKYPVVEPFDIENINVNAEMTEELTSEESQYLTQIEKMINDQILAGEYNLANLEMLMQSIAYGTQSSSQPGNTTTQSTTGSTTSK
jgi:parallel beta-helix repeat protein